MEENRVDDRIRYFIKDLNVFHDGRGYSIFDVFPVARLDEFQINISTIYPGTIKAFHKHMQQTDYWFVISGAARVVLVDEKIRNPKVFHLSERRPQVLEIPPNTWHGIKGIGNKECTMLYLVDKRYNNENADELRCPWDAFGKNKWMIRHQ